MNGVEINTRAYVATRLLLRGDPQNEGLRGLQPRALGSKLDYFHAGSTSLRLHRQPNYGYTGRFIRPMNQPTHINICSFNARSLRNKMTELSQFINLHKIHILAVCESWLSDLDTDLSVALPGFQVPFRKDRKTKGGVYVYTYPTKSLVRSAKI